ncbi:MAG: hypothetical protein CMD23_02115 [Flavobacteriales bacterium]|nr:hypothetical protein [Flavobacteriales bacterium]
MFSLQKIVFFIFCISCFSLLHSQTTGLDVDREIHIMLKEKSSKENRKKVRQFLRFLNSDKISEAEQIKVYSVLNSFNSRKISFNSGGILFLEVLLLLDESDLSNKILVNLLDFLMLDKKVISNLDIRVFLKKIIHFLNSEILSSSSDFQWKCVGDFHLDFTSNKTPGLYFTDSQLLLFNAVDTVSLLNVSGHYDILENVFYANSARSPFSNDVFSIDFRMESFSLNLNKNFFKIENTSLSSNKIFYGNSIGVYKNKLSSSSSYPSFMSYSTNHEFEIFEGIKIVGGLELKGDMAYFNNSGGRVDFYFKDSQMEYLISSPHFQLSDDKLFCSSAQLCIKNENDSISHPSVKVTYHDNEKKIIIDRLSGKRGLNPIRNTFHGINIFADRMEIDLVYDECLLFHYSPADDISVLFESDTYFDKERYEDLLKFDFNPGGLLLEFLFSQSIDGEYDFAKFYSTRDFSLFSKFDMKSTLNIILDLEIFGLLSYDSFSGLFKVNPWAVQFMNAEKREFDYDNLKIESLVGIGDTVAKIDFYLNEMDIFRINKFNITNRFQFLVRPRMSQVKFFGEKNFLLDGDLYIGNFAFSGNDIQFNYDDFAFYFGLNSLMLFPGSQIDGASSSVIHFDEAVLLVDSLDNKSGLEQLNDFPRFHMSQAGYLSYLNNPVNFLLDPFQISYLHDVSLSNLTFNGALYLDGLIDELKGELNFDKFGDLQTTIEAVDSVGLYKDKVKFQGVLNLTSSGLFASGNFVSDNLVFSSDNIELSSAKIVGSVKNIQNGINLIDSPFITQNILLNYFPYESSFLIKTISDTVTLYSKFNLFGDLYFDGENLNGRGEFYSDYSTIVSSHHYFSSDNIMSADASCIIYDQKKIMSPCFSANSVSVEQHLFSDSVFVSKSTTPFHLPFINYSVDFDFLFFDLKSREMYFENNQLSSEGTLITEQYGKKGFAYNALDAVYNIETNELCVNSVFPIPIKKFLIQPSNNSFCVLSNGKFPVFKNATLIKNRRVFKDKLYNNKDISIQPNLKFTIIND